MKKAQWKVLQQSYIVKDINMMLLFHAIKDW